MKIVFIENQIPQNGQVPEKVFGCSYTIYPTPNLASLYNAAVLLKAGHQVELYKLKTLANIREIPKADIYIIHSVILSMESDVKIGAKLSSKVFYFGPAPTLFTERYLNNSRSFVLRGETEHIVASAIDAPQKTLGVSYLRNGKIIHNKTAGVINDLDSIPFPARELDPDIFSNPKLGSGRFTNVLASRGCANKCKFCVPNSISWARELEWKKFNSGKPPVKTRTATNVIEELKHLKKVGYDEISFIDDQFIVGKSRTIEIVKAIENIKIDFGILARADKLNNEEIVQSLACAKCKYVDIGAESFNQAVLDDIHKGIKVETIIEAVNLLAKHKVEPKLNIMFGTSSKENKRIINDTIKRTLSLPTNYCMFSIATPFPGTELAREAERNGWIIKQKEFNPAGVSSLSYPHLSNTDLERIVRSANYRFYLRPKVVGKQLSKIKSIKEAKKFFSMVRLWKKNFRKS